MDISEKEDFKWNESAATKLHSAGNIFNLDVTIQEMRNRYLNPDEYHLEISDSISNSTQKSNLNNPEKNILLDSTISPHQSFSISDDLSKSSNTNYENDTSDVHYDKILPFQTIQRILNGQKYFLENYRSREDKIDLLDNAIKSGDGNAILIAVLFLERTLKSMIFNLELNRRPIAADQYITCLKHLNQTSKLLDFLGMLNRTEQAAIIKFKMAASSHDVSTLKRCLGSHFSSDPSLTFEASAVQTHINLLELQLPIQDSDSKEIQQGLNVLFKDHPPTASLIGTSCLSTLYYSSFYHHNLAENMFASPQYIKKFLKLSDKQFQWKNLSALTRLKQWNKIDELFLSKSWMGSVRMRSAIGFDRVVSFLNKMSAPNEIKEKYCSMVENLELRLEVSMKYNCPETVIKTCCEMRDRKQLETYVLNLKPNTPEYIFAKTVLEQYTVKWKN